MSIIKCTAKLSRIMFPRTSINAGDFGIVSMKLIEELDGNVVIDPKWETFIVKGNFCKLNFFDTYNLTAKEVDDKKWGKQYEVVFINTSVNLDSIKDQRTFFDAVLSEKQVESLFSLPNPLEVIKNGDIKTLCSLNGIQEKTAMKIISRYESTKDHANIYVELAEYNLTTSMIKKLINVYKSPDTIIEKIKKNIYVLADEVNGVGFKKVDDMAMAMGMKKNNPNRVRSFILYHLNKETENGNSWIHTHVLLDAVRENCGHDIDMGIVRTVMTDLREQKVIVTNSNRSVIALEKIHKLEMEILEQINRIFNGSNDFQYNNWKEVISNIEKRQGWEYTDQQVDGVKTVLDNQVTLVTGLAGTGKSTVTNAMIEIMEDNDYTVSQCALSGRASQRMKELNGRDSSTIHRLLGIGENGESMMCQIYSDVVLLDEASMVDGVLFLKLLKAIRTGTKLVIIGDRGQLPSIGVCNVFFDLLEYTLPVVNLTVVHRQAQASAIISKSIELRNNIQLFDSDFEGDAILGDLQDLELNIYKEKEILHSRIVSQFLRHYNTQNKDLMKVQIVVPMKSRGDICTKALNATIQEKVNDLCGMDANFYITDSGSAIYEGDKVINNRNAKAKNIEGESIQIFNGNIGVVKSIDKSEGLMTVYFFDLGQEVIIDHEHIKEHIDLGYAITCHKLQGSSCHTVIVGIDFGAYTMLSCEFIYTAITRAEKYCVLVAENGAVRYGISKALSANKQTFIKIEAQKEAKKQ